MFGNVQRCVSLVCGEKHTAAFIKTQLLFQFYNKMKVQTEWICLSQWSYVAATLGKPRSEQGAFSSCPALRTFVRWRLREGAWVTAEMNMLAFIQYEYLLPSVRLQITINSRSLEFAFRYLYFYATWGNTMVVGWALKYKSGISKMQLSQ